MDFCNLAIVGANYLRFNVFDATMAKEEDILTPYSCTAFFVIFLPVVIPARFAEAGQILEQASTVPFPYSKRVECGLVLP